MECVALLLDFLKRAACCGCFLVEVGAGKKMGEFFSRRMTQAAVKAVDFGGFKVSLRNRIPDNKGVLVSSGDAGGTTRSGAKEHVFEISLVYSVGFQIVEAHK